MNRSLIVATLCLYSASAYSMTAVVAPATPPAGAPAAPATSATTNAAPDVRSSGVASTPSKSTAPSAASVLRPAAVLSAPGVPAKASATQTARPGVAPTKANTFMPSSANQAAGATAPAPANAAWATTAHGASGIRRGTLEAINFTTGTLQVYGQKLSFNTQRVKVFTRDGRPGSIFTVKSGAKIRFTLDPAEPSQRRVAVIYLD